MGIQRLSIEVDIDLALHTPFIEDSTHAGHALKGISDLFVDNFRRVDKDKIRIDPHARFERMCRRHGIPFVSVKPRLAALRREMMDGAIPWDDLYIPDDYTHLSATGNQVVAEAILERLEEDELMTARPASRRRL